MRQMAQPCFVTEEVVNVCNMYKLGFHQRATGAPGLQQGKFVNSVVPNLVQHHALQRREGGQTEFLHLHV